MQHRKKTEMKKNKYLTLGLFGVLLWVLETAYFGWNSEPINAQEKMLDIISWLFILWGIIGDIATNISIHKTNHITTQNVEIKDATIESATQKEE